MINAYHRLFYGALAFSVNPDKRLEELGMHGLKECVDETAWSVRSKQNECVVKYESRMSFNDLLVVLHNEPTIIIGMVREASRGMQQFVSYLGKFSFENPQKTTEVHQNFLNLWPTFQMNYFPQGKWLILTLVFYSLVFGVTIARRYFIPVAEIGLMASVATFFDMFAAILGDGKYELVKHLFLANALFSVATIMFTALLLSAIVTQCRVLLKKERRSIF